jgi:hypothetical protein
VVSNIVMRLVSVAPTEDSAMSRGLRALATEARVSTVSVRSFKFIQCAYRPLRAVAGEGELP